MNVWKAFPLLQVTANPLSTNEQTRLATVCKPVKNRQELRSTQGPISTWELMPQKKYLAWKGPARFTVCAQALCTCYFCICLPIYRLKERPIFEAHKKSLHGVQLASTCAVRGETQGIWTFSIGVQLIHLLLCDSLLVVVLRSSAKTWCLLSAGHCNNIHPERLGEDYNPSAFFAVHNLMNL